MDAMRAPDRVGRGLGEAEIADLPRPLELRHRADGLLDGHGAIDAVLVVEIDVVHAEAPERGVASLADMFGSAVLPEPCSLLVPHVPELGREHDLVSAVADRAAHELLVRVGPVYVGRVDERDAEIERAVDRGDGLIVVARTIELGHSHAAESQGRDLEPLPQRTLWNHVNLLSSETARDQRAAW